MAENGLLFDRNICDYALAFFRVVVSGCMVATVVGMFNFYGEFQVLKSNVSSINVEISRGYLPKARELFAQVMAEMAAQRRDIERLDKSVRDLSGADK